MRMLSVIILLSVFIAGGIIGYLARQPLTGYASISSGQTTSLGEQQKTNPSLGAVKGYLFYTIQDGSSGIVSKVPAANASFYLVKNGVSIGDWSRVKDSGSDVGTLENIDADDSGSKCSPRTFLTDVYYEDENNNSVKDQNEKEINYVLTDSNGCFAILAKPGNWDYYT